ncbi:uncharacterized protein LOC132726926 [Ruditapes philippinarum]|uniref:uncharacterized protein LOC132726926 n=1 Tax=Ruditapes philippinarum TaxID=129788 RepID=UPI00295BDF53|nr:uncharacterized protein LOC132726926 [Ruditapes philippinarum]
MTDIKSVFKGRSGPYDKGLRVQCVAVGTPITYTGKDTQVKQVLAAAISDSKDVIKVSCYDPSKFRFFQVDKALILKNFIKKEEDGKSVVVTKVSKIAFGAPMTGITEEQKALGQSLINPPKAQLVSVAEALSSPKKKKSSVQGKLIQEEASKMVKVGGEEVKIKNVVIEDESGHAKVTLWRELASADVRTGEFVQITDVQTNYYMDQTSLSTTMRSNLEKIDAPEYTFTITVVGISVDDGLAELFTDGEGTSTSATEVTVPAELLQQALATNDGYVDLEAACEEGPFRLSISRKGTDILNIAKI